MLKGLTGAICALLAGLGWTATAHGETVTFAYNGTNGTDGSPQTWVVPADVTTATFDLYGASGGASGGASFSHAPGGAGAHLTATLPVTPGETLTIRVGGAAPGFGSEHGGYNGGGGSMYSGNTWELAGGGGGATDVRRGAGTPADRVLVAGGGGGGGAYGFGPGSGGSAGVAGGNGGPSGSAGSPGVNLSGSVLAGGGGQPGGSVAGGAGGAGGSSLFGGGLPGAAGAAGSGAATTDGLFGAAGGGGGGWYGGGAGGTGGRDASLFSAGSGGGGGGSSHAAAAATGVSVVEGANVGNGSVVITYTPAVAPPPPPSGPGTPTIGTVDLARSEPAGGGVLTITGGGFSDGTVVRFGDVVGVTTVLRYDRLRAVVPPHVAGVVALTVTTAGGTSAPFAFTYVEPRTAAAPERPAARDGEACVVPRLRRLRVHRARSALAAAGCRLGEVRRSIARRGPRRARVVAQSRRAGTRLASGTEIDVTTRRRRHARRAVARRPYRR